MSNIFSPENKDFWMLVRKFLIEFLVQLDSAYGVKTVVTRDERRFLDAYYVRS